MSVIRPTPPEDPLEIALAPLLATWGTTAAALAPRGDQLERARAAADEEPLAQLPDRLLADYNGTTAGRTRATSELYAVLQAARRIRDTVDRVVVLGDPGMEQGTRAVFASCCHPFHNELSRGERGGRPRLSFVGHGADADLLQGFVDLVSPAGAARGDDLLDRWAIVLCDAVPGAAMNVLLPLLLRSVGGDRSRLADRVVAVTRATGSAAGLAAEIGCSRMFTLPDGAGGGRGVFTPATLLPAAIVGIDVVRLLQGATAMNRRFREAAADQNPVLQVASASWLAIRQGAAPPRLNAPDTERLRDVVHWHEQLAAPATFRAATAPVATAITLRAGEPRRDPLAAVPLRPPGDPPDETVRMLDRVRDHMRMPRTAASAAPSASADTAVIRLPRTDEHAIGQLLQMLLLAAIVAERLAR